MYIILIKIIVDKRILSLEEIEEHNSIPEFLTFLIIIDSTYPDSPPHVLSKTNVNIPY
jgi:hypothetical protein